MVQPSTPVATSLVDFLVAAPARIYPAEVLDAAHMCLVDWAGVAIGAVRLDAVRVTIGPQLMDIQ